MARHVHRHFRRKVVSDGDSSDIEGNSLSKGINLDFDEGIGLGIVRPGTVDYRPTLGTLPTTTHRLYRVLKWDSGIETTQHNTLLIYRSFQLAPLSPTGWVDVYSVYTNAFNGGDGHGYTYVPGPTGGAFIATHCEPIAEQGSVRIALGHANSQEYLIITNLCEDGDHGYPWLAAPVAVGLPTGSNSISSTTNDDLDYGDGGKVYNGWLVDYGKLYAGSTNSIYAQFTFGFYTAATLPANYVQLEAADYEIAIVPVYDSYEYQYALATYGYMARGLFEGSSPATAITLTLKDITDAAKKRKFNKRISHLAVYAKVSNQTNDTNDTDFRRIALVPFDTTLIPATVFLVIDYNRVWMTESTWLVDGRGRPMLPPNLAITRAGYIASAIPDDDDIDAYIAVRPKGFMLRRKRMYAWGLADDPGQSRIAVSPPDNIYGGQLDVFWYTNRIWRSGSQETMHLAEWFDRMFLVNRTNMYMIDLEQRLDDQTMTIDTGIGIGTSIVRTLALTPRAIFFANYDSVWRMTSGDPQDIMHERVRNEWRALSSDYKDDAVAGYCNFRDEYWLAVQTSAAIYSVYVWSDSTGRDGWRVYRFAWSRSGAYTDLKIEGFFNDLNNNWILYGNKVSNGGVVLGTPIQFVVQFYGENASGSNVTGDYEPTDGEDIVYYPIDYEFVSQWVGVRADESVVHRTDYQRNVVTPVTTNNHRAFLDLYMNRIDSPAVTIDWPFNRRLAARTPKMRCNEYKFGVYGRWTDDTTAKPEIYEVTIETADTQKRSR